LGVTGKDGKFSISTSKNGQYLISTTSVGYSPAYSSKFEVSGSGAVNVPEIIMVKSSGNLQNVSVVRKKTDD
jgi:hypothetical protein